ncbi:hypothetical protein AB670_02761 [Chryseobacterium sp. MOF25P]|uniref:hypothetical protein n=1 Tax=unclassified Chryseobacterium TaxID=2593645 RepID=UPI0008051203|nr:MULTISPECIES: hypothetical protein [unclassified Chryseobacterium]OBW40810.1 hypothetical protein AB670_02761 [Chryseobacterium sp. MOF25P]OBW45274.1 hypothetical protein AB671_02571 [Chryseobacterium sp. BGARF1]
MDQIFKDNPKVDIYYKTSDDTPFFSKNAAQNHAKTLEQKNLETIVRGSVKNSEGEKGAEVAKALNDEPKLTPKQQLQADYEKKFGEVPAEEFTKAELSEAIEKGEKLVAKPNTDQ